MAADALTALGVTEPPVPVDALVASFGIPVRGVSLPQFFTAATVYEDGLPVMIVNLAKPEYDRRRALAHMLAHVLLVLKEDGHGYPRDAGGHEEADMVAREIMTPSMMVIDQARLWFNDHRYLARLFGVEETEMLERMQQLGIIRAQQGIMWDF